MTSTGGYPTGPSPEALPKEQAPADWKKTRNNIFKQDPLKEKDIEAMYNTTWFELRGKILRQETVWNEGLTNALTVEVFNDLQKKVALLTSDGVSTALSLLNSLQGHEGCPEGRCLVWSESTQKHFLLFRVDMDDKPKATNDHFTHQFTCSRKGPISDAYAMAKKPMGEGNFGRVFQGKHKHTGAQRAIKEIAKSKIKDIAKFDNEVRIQQSLDHPNIVKLYETFTDSRNVFLVMEMCTGGELFDAIIDAVDASKTGMCFDEKHASSYVQQITGAMRYLHGKSFVHRDIKPENFLMEDKSENAQIKIIDFGLAAEFKSGVPLKTKAGTPFYVAPQVLSGSYDEKCDVWSCGVITYILLAGYPPFHAEEDKDILAKVRKGKFDFPSPDWDGVSKSGKDFIKQMLTMSPESRPSFESLLGHRWLSDHADKGTGQLHAGLSSSLTKFRDSTKFKKLALTVLAQQLSDSSIQELKATFKALDENNDGTLTIEEIRNGIEKSELEIDMSVLAQLDTDGSGVIDYTEFIAATLDHKKHVTEAALWSAFSVFDEDGNGTITREELKKLTQSTDDPMISAMIKEVDIDGDGQISWEEFKSAMVRS